MKLLVVANVSDRSEFSLYLELLKRGIEVDLVCDPREKKIDSFREYGGKAYILKIRHRFDWKAIRFLRDLIKMYDYDVVYTPFNKGLATCTLAMTGLPPKLITYRGTLGNISYLNPADYLTYLNPKLDAIACNCNAVKKSVASYGISEKKLRTIYKGHQIEWYTHGQQSKRTELGIPDDALVIGCIANMRPLKGIDILLAAFERLRDLPSAHLVLVGENRDKRIQKMIDAHPFHERIHPLGFREDASELAGIFDIAVMPSVRREGLPRAIIESIAQGVPAIVSDVGGMPELVLDNQTGTVVPPGDTSALTKALSEMAESPQRRDEYGRAGKKHLETKFNIEDYVSHMLELFQDCTKSL